jgi:hypothetical protein
MLWSRLKWLKISSSGRHNNLPLDSLHQRMICLLSSVFFGGPGAGAATVTDITSARSENNIIMGTNDAIMVHSFGV